MRKSLLLAGVAVIATAAYMNTVKAADQDIGATVDLIEALTLTGAVDMDFGSIEFTGSANGNVTLGTNGTVAGTSGYTSSAGTGTAGSVVINGTTGEGVDISCEASGTLSDGTNTMPMNATEVVVETGVASGSGTACAGLGTSPLTHTIAGVTAQDTVLVGATIDGSTTPAAGGTYNTSNASGDPVTVRVTYQ